MSSSEKHEQFWFAVEDSVVTVGVNANALEKTGEVIGLEIPDEGSEFQEGEIVISLMGAQGAIEWSAPVSGVIVGTNEELQKDLAVINEDPSDFGWMIKIQLQDPQDVKKLS